MFSRGLKAASIRVGGPGKRGSAPRTLPARLRVRVLRTGAGGGVAVGSDAAGGIVIAREEVANANALWGQCGIQFGAPAELDVAVVDPPPPHMISVGCGLGLPAQRRTARAASGTAALRAATGGGLVPGARRERDRIAASPCGIQRLAQPRTLARASPRTARSTCSCGAPRATTCRSKWFTPGPSRPAPRRVPRRSQPERRLEPLQRLGCAAGTLEERALLKAIADDDPDQIDVLVLPYFVTVGRIGESFVDAAGLGVRNAIIIDRAGVRAGAALVCPRARARPCPFADGGSPRRFWRRSPDVPDGCRCRGPEHFRSSQAQHHGVRARRAAERPRCALAAPRALAAGVGPAREVASKAQPLRFSSLDTLP